MRPRFWYCPLCGYMFFESADFPVGGAGLSRDCPLCGGEAVPCWECIAGGVFDGSWCAACDRTAECRAVHDAGAGRRREEK